VVAPAADELAVRVVDVLVQVSTPELLADTVTVICVANNGLPIREENRKSNINFIYIGLDHEVKNIIIAV